MLTLVERHATIEVVKQRLVKNVLLLPLVACALAMACGARARHHGSGGMGCASQTAAISLHPMLDEAAGTASCGTLPDITSESKQPRHEPNCSDGALAVMVFATHLRKSVLRAPPASLTAVLSARRAFRRGFMARLERNAVPTTHTVLLM